MCSQRWVPPPIINFHIGTPQISVVPKTEKKKIFCSFYNNNNEALVIAQKYLKKASRRIFIHFALPFSVFLLPFYILLPFPLHFPLPLFSLSSFSLSLPFFPPFPLPKFPPNFPSRGWVTCPARPPLVMPLLFSLIFRKVVVLQNCMKKKVNKVNIER